MLKKTNPINRMNSTNPMNPKNPEQIRTQILDLVKEYHAAKFAHKTFDPDKDMVHYAGRVFDAEEIVNLVDAGLDFYLTTNRYAERFEAEFAEYLGLSNALLVNSGSSANLVALTTLSRVEGSVVEGITVH